MTVKEKLIACALGALFVLLLVATYAFLVVTGKADVAPFLALLSSLVMAAVALVNGIAGHAAGVGALDSPQPVAPKPAVPAGLPASPTAPTAQAASAGTALAPPAALQ